MMEKTTQQIVRFISVIFVCAIFIPPIGSARAEGVVNIYSSRQPIFLAPVIAAFTDETGIVVNTFFAKAGLLERLKAEGDESPADVIIAADIGRMVAFADAGLAAELRDAILESSVPPTLRDDKGKWFAATRRARIIFASPEIADEIRSYADLADEKFRGMICIRSGRHPYNIALIASAIAREGDAPAKKWLDGIKKNLARRPQGNDRAQIRGVQSGECKIGIANSYYFFKMLDAMNESEQADLRKRVALILPGENGGETHINISGMILAKNAKNRPQGIEFMRFLASEKAQKIYAEINRELPIRNGIPLPPILSEYFSDFVGDAISLVEIARHRSAASQLAEEVGFDF